MPVVLELLGGNSGINFFHEMWMGRAVTLLHYFQRSTPVDFLIEGVQLSQHGDRAWISDWSIYDDNALLGMHVVSSQLI